MPHFPGPRPRRLGTDYRRGAGFIFHHFGIRWQNAPAPVGYGLQAAVLRWPTRCGPSPIQLSPDLDRAGWLRTTGEVRGSFCIFLLGGPWKLSPTLLFLGVGYGCRGA